MQIKNWLLLAFLFLNYEALMGQTTLNGTVIDTVNQHQLPDVTITILNRADSMLYSFAHSNHLGKFVFNNVMPNKYIMIVSKRGYADLIDTIIVSSSQTNLKTISLIPKGILLDEVLINKRVDAVVIRGDTTEYNVDRFKVPKNASVEDMLKLLPGIQVDRNGNISVQGRSISKVLVDDEEFFSDDYTLVTKNFKSKMINKVQVYDKTSSFSKDKTKVVNLQLKENSKNGFFGKAVIGGAPKSTYENQLMINRFKGKMKASIFGTFSNTDLIGLGGKNRETYAEGIDETITYDIDLDTWDGNYSGFGLPKNASLGTHFSNRFDNDRQSFSLNYKLSSLKIDVQEKTLSEITLPNNTIYSENNSLANNNRLNNSFKTGYEIKLDSTALLRFEISALSNDKNSTNRFDSYQLNNDLDTINSGYRDIASKTRFQRLSTNINFEKYITMPRRIFGLTLGQTKIEQNSRGNLSSIYKIGATPDDYEQLTTNQDKFNSSKSNYYKIKAYYTEPIHQYWDITLNYAIDFDSNRSKLETYNLGANIYKTLDSAFSGVYDFDRIINKGGFSVLYKKNKIRLLLASDIGHIALNQNDLSNQDNFDKKLFYLYPKASLVYSFSPQKSIEFRYEGDVLQPTVQQFQPVRNNIDPLNIYSGNMGIVPFYKHTYFISYNNYIPTGKKYLFGNFTFTTLDDPIGLKVNTNAETGQSMYQYANIGSSYQYNGYLGIGKQISTISEGSIGVNFNVDGFKNNIILNGVMSDVRSSIYSLAPYANKNFQNGFRMAMSFNTKYNINRTSLQESRVGNFWQHNLSGNFYLDLPLDFSLSVDANLEFRQKNATFNDNVNIFVISSVLEKKFLKEKNLLLRLSGNDLLNQRIGFRRYITYNSVSQQTYNTLSRYFLISLNWDFNRMKTQ
ncbi:outer membrane beta-barrel protein [Pedobacter sp. MR2016-19]|uniref:outer membrane beta-barrel protein n=1 Tax=Pedobacter sp. MR2016-19 TaxID=2780089 RepID=UPI001876F88C|nr:outer membrane beta-barrel protein [Pedobacter sp. MR2016-19]MBE5317741.1 outer membrane beta-barrel protein [Pedobacter sp. MR2016-19]